MSTPPNPTRTRHPERPDGMRHGKGQDGYTTTQPTPLSRPRPGDDDDVAPGGGWGRSDGEEPLDGPEDGDGY